MHPSVTQALAPAGKIRVLENHSMQRSIAGRLLFWFLVIALIPCAILTAITARIASSALDSSVRNKLVQIAAAKANELEAYAMERVRDGTALARVPSIMSGLEELIAASEKGRPSVVAAQTVQRSAEVRPFEFFWPTPPKRLATATCCSSIAMGRFSFA